jgi:large subunit ribosomal protein L7/L12
LGHLSLRSDGVAIIGILFDIEALDKPWYGKAAYEILFKAVNCKVVRSVHLYDGDAATTLHRVPQSGPHGNARMYCIAIESDDETTIQHIAERLAVSGERGLCPPESRFIRDAAVKAEPLVFAGAIDAHGVLILCDTPWIAAAWPGEAKSTYDVVLKEAGGNKISVIKAVRDSVPGLSLGEAKALVDGAPRTIKKDVALAEGSEIRRKIEAAGAKVEIE